VLGLESRPLDEMAFIYCLLPCIDAICEVFGATHDSPPPPRSMVGTLIAADVPVLRLAARKHQAQPLNLKSLPLRAMLNQ